jgi:2-C-methyl-D-erythritol 4-phosphate cytidylyltransferase
MNKNLDVIIASAGISRRLNLKTPKPFIKINNKPVLWYSLYSFQKIDNVKNIYVVIAPDMSDFAEKIKMKYFRKFTKFKSFIIGGENRINSVFNALDHINSNDPAEYIAIHDAARPFITEEMILRIYEQASLYGAASCGIPVVDTVKECSGDKFIRLHLKREDLIAIQTPQIFKYKKLFSAYKKVINKNKVYTDDTEIYGLYNKKIKIIEGSPDLLKITFKNDLKTAKIILRNNKKLWK